MIAVLDASMTLALALQDESAGLVERVATALIDATVHVPAHWALETSNGLLMAVRRGRLTPEEAQRAKELILYLPVIQDTETATQAWTYTFALADAHRLTQYDAAYLELAMRLDVPLATLDTDLAAAAKAAGVALWT